MKSDTLNVIVVSAAPMGRFLEGIISGTPLPGTMMQIKASTEPINGRFTWEVFNGAADGERTLVAILLEDRFQPQKGIEDAYTTGHRGFLYCPIGGDELLVRVAAPGTGTGNAFAIGDKLMHDDGTGLFVATTGSPESEPFIITETVTDVVSTGTLVQVMYTGH